MKTLISLLMPLISCAALFAQDKMVMPTSITHVTVYNSGAQVLRVGQLDIPKGKSTIRIIGLTPDLDPKSIQLRANDGVSILSIAHEWNTSSKAVNDHSMDSLQARIKSLDRQSQLLSMRQGVLNKKMKLLEANEALGGTTVGVDIIHLEKALYLYDSVYMSTSMETLNIGSQLDSIRQERAILEKKISEIRGTPLVSKSEIELLVQADHPATLKIDLSYIVKHAGWIPRYDIRADAISQPIIVAYKAEVHQQTGEVWKDVILAFSNASPYARQTAPTLEPWKLTTLSKTTFKRIGTADNIYGPRVITGRVVDESGEALIFANVSIPGHLIGVQTDLNGDFTIVVPQEASMLNVSYTGYESQNLPITQSDMNVVLKTGALLETAVVVGSRSNATDYYIDGIRVNNMPVQTDQLTVVVKNQVSVSFELDHPVTVLSDGKNTSHEMQTYEIDADYHYELVPKVDQSAYLVATLTEWEQYHLIEGMANLYFKNTFIGKTLLDPQSLSDTLEISLGRDPDVMVEREVGEVYSKKSFLASSSVIDKTYTITLRNKKSDPVQVRVIDQVPVSVNDAVTVTVGELSGGKHEPLTGMVQWDKSIAPTSSEQLRLGYTVKFPAKEKVFLD